MGVKVGESRALMASYLLKLWKDSYLYFCICKNLLFWRMLRQTLGGIAQNLQAPQLLNPISWYGMEAVANFRKSLLHLETRLGLGVGWLKLLSLLGLNGLVGW